MRDSTCPALGRLAAACAALAIASAASAQIYVDDDAPPGGDGKSWNTAFRDLQDALEVANSTPVSEIRVAQGTYRPDRGTGVRAATFALECASITSSLTVWLQGGFAGRGAPHPDQRDPETFVTVLSGDLNGDDAPGFMNRADNSLHVVTARQQGRQRVLLTLDGLTVRGGNANTGPNLTGGGVLTTGSAHYPPGLALLGCRILDNEALGDGGGVFHPDAQVYAKAAVIRGNRAAGTGGGVRASEIFAQQTQFAENSAKSGGGLAATTACTLEECELAGNRAVTGHGGGALAQAGAWLEDCRITSNSAAQTGGGVAISGSGNLRHCTITNNSAASGGGFFIEFGSDTTAVEGSILWNNAAQVGAQGAFQGASYRLDVNRSDIEGGQAGMSTPPGRLVWHSTNITENPAFADADGPDNNFATWEDNDERLGFSSPCIDRGSAASDGTFEKDLDQDARVVNARDLCQSRPDLGAYEFPTSVAALPIPRLYVNAAAAPGGNGRSWWSAYRTLQEAILTPGVREIWMARGTYTPGPATDDLLSHDIGCDLTILGGFVGNELLASLRDPETNLTVLSGQNTQRVFLVNGADLTLDGVVVTHGYWDRAPSGGGLSSVASTVRIVNCRWIDNGVGPLGVTAPGGGAVVTETTALTIEDSTFDGNFSSQGAAVDAERGNVALRRCDFVNNAATVTAGAVYLATHSFNAVIVEDCGFGGNRAVDRAGAVMLDWGTRATFRGCLFAQNFVESSVDARGGALCAWSATVQDSMFLGNRAIGPASEGGRAAGGAAFVEDASTFINCFFSGNRAEGAGEHAGGGAIAIQGPTTMVNCTMTLNAAEAAWQAESEGGGVWINRAVPGPASLTASNSVLWNNWVPTGGATEAAQVAASPADVTIDHSAVRGWTGIFGGEGNHGDNPLFIDLVGPDGQAGTLDDDPRLGAFSACIDAGRNSAVPGGVGSDVLGNPRFVDDAGVPNTGSGPGPIVDMGAAEAQEGSCYADCNTDGMLNLADFGCFQVRYALGLPEADCNQDGVLSLSDFGCFQTRFAMGCP